MSMQGIITWMAPIIAGLITCAGQLWLNQRFKRSDEVREDERKATNAKRAAEAEWREAQ